MSFFVEIAKSAILQEMQKIAKVAPFRAGAVNAYRTNGILTILELILLKCRILAQFSENERFLKI